MIPQYSQQNKVFFYTIMVILGALGLWLVSGYLGVIVFSMVMVIILKPVYDFFERLLRGRAGLATTATILALFLAILIPSWMMLQIVTNQVHTIIESFTISESGEPLTLEDFQTQVNDLADQIPSSFFVSCPSSALCPPHRTPCAASSRPVARGKRGHSRGGAGP